MRGLEPNVSPNLDATLIAQALVPDVFQAVGEAAALDERKRSLLRRNKTVSMTAGVGTLTDDVLTAYMEDATFFDPADLSKSYSWIREYYDFVNYADARLGYFNVRDGVTLLQREPGEDFATTLSFTGNMTLSIPCVPEVPASQDVAVDVVPEIASDIVEALAAALRGQLVKAA